MNPEKFHKELKLEHTKNVLELTSSIESYMGMKLFMVFKCIKCGIMIDDSYDAITHAARCKLPKEYTQTGCKQ